MPRSWVERYNALEELIREEIADTQFNGDPDPFVKEEIALGNMLSRLLENRQTKSLLNALGYALEDQNHHRAASKLFVMSGRSKEPYTGPDHIEVNHETRWRS